MSSLHAEYFKKIEYAASFIQKKIKTSPRIGIILGSGLGGFLHTMKGISIEYSDIPGLPSSCIPGQQGIFKADNVCAVFAGRFHYYEGYSLAEVVFPVFLLHKIGVRQLIVTNAAGGINPAYNPGDLVLIKDHINLLRDTPLRGPYCEERGIQFPDMSDAYSKKMRERVKKYDICPSHEGVYAALPGPNYETPAEVRMLKLIGVDMVGMSTVPEVIAAASLSLDVLGISCIVNKAGGEPGRTVTHEEVIRTGEKAGQKLSSFLEYFCAKAGSGV